jgi:phytanoyl-CoA hydroxylase
MGTRRRGKIPKEGQMVTIAETYVRQFHQDGFVVIPGVIPPGEVEDLRSQLRHYTDAIAPALPLGEVYYEEREEKVIKALHNLDRHSPYFKKLSGDARWAAIGEAIFGVPVMASGTSLFAKAAGVGSATPAHQDQAFQFWAPAEAFTLTIALDASTAENGPLICLKGSHRLGLLPHVQSGILGFSRRLKLYPPPEQCEEMAVYMHPGDVSLHHALTVHRSGANRSTRSRWQFGIGFHSARAIRDDRAFERYLQSVDSLHESNGPSAGLG